MTHLAMSGRALIHIAAMAAQSSKSSSLKRRRRRRRATESSGGRTRFMGLPPRLILAGC